MRASLTIAMLVLVLPSASAGFTWLAPEQALVGQPVTAAYAIVESEEPLRLMGHQNVQIQVLDPNGTILSDTTSVHEHDGFHSFMFTPQTSGDHTLVATHREETHEWTMAVSPSEPNPALQAQFDDLRLVVQEDGGTTWIGTDYAESHSIHMTPGQLLDLYDDEGMQVLSTWQNGAMPVRVGEAFGSFHPTALLTGPDNQASASHAFGLRALSAPEVIREPGDAVLPTIPVYPDQTQTCAEADIPLFVDPGSQSEAQDAWQTDTDLRVAVVDLQRATASESGTTVSYGLRTRDVEFEELFSAISGDAFGQITFRVRQPGAYILNVYHWDEERSCSFEFNIDDGPLTGGPDDSAPADLVHQVNVEGTAATIDLAVDQPDGSRAGHYEFDTRVYRVNTQGPDGALVWKGKLHGHASEVSLALGGLAAGEYQVRVFPSPQDGATLAAISPDSSGFRFGFQVDEAAPPETVAKAPGLGLAALVAAIAAVAVARRR